MNILILSWRGPGHPNEGGAEQVTHEHSKVWINAGHNVTLFTSSFDGAKFHEEIDGVKIIRQGDQILTVQLRALFWYLFGKHEKFDLVVDQFHGIPFFTPLFAKCKRLGFIHEIAKDVWAMNPWNPPFNKIPALLGPKVERIIFKLLYKNTPFLTVSESTRDDLVDYGVKKANIHIIHNGFIKPRTTRIIKKDQRKTAVFLGAIATDKGIEDAVKVFYEIDRKDDRWQFWIVGKAAPTELRKLRKWIEENNLKDKVKIWGFVSERKKFELLSRSHVLVNTSFHEGWGLVNIEANSVGTPVAAYKVHGIKDSVQDGKTGILVEKRNTREMASRILELIRSDAAYAKMSSESLKWSKKFEWARAGNASLELIESL